MGPESKTSEINSLLLSLADPDYCVAMVCFILECYKARSAP